MPMIKTGTDDGLPRDSLSSSNFAENAASIRANRSQKLGLVMVDEFLPLEGVALMQMLERLLVIADIGKGFAQGEVQPDLVFGAVGFHLAGQVLHGRKCGSPADIRLEVART